MDDLSAHSAGAVLVTGGCGFVGRHVVARLVRDGRTLWLIDDLSTGQLPATWLPTLGLRPLLAAADVFVHPNGARVTWLCGDVRRVLRAALLGDKPLPSFSDV